ncbi:hypothetical protein KQI84_17120 [bacterium]|nr:hypothetical protein [bacterium]
MKILPLFLLIALLSACATPSTKKSDSKFSPEDDALLEEISSAAFQFFWQEADPVTGLVRDKTGVNDCSVASQGFAFATYPVAVERGWVTRKAAEDRVLRSLRALDQSNARHEGIFTHFVDMKTGNVTMGGYESEVSSIDTALLAAGMITAGNYFGGEARMLADKIYAEMNWKAWVDPERNQVYMAWRPAVWGEMTENGKFDKQTWDWYTDEALLISIVGISAPIEEHRLPASNLTSWVRREGDLGDLHYTYSWPSTLFTYIFAQCFADFSRMGPDPGGTDWFFNTAMASRANRDWCRSMAGDFPTYGQNRWGITACSAPNDSYAVPGHQPRGEAGDNPCGGIVAPYGAGMAVPFMPADAITALRHMKGLVIDGKPVWIDPTDGGYGFVDSFIIDQSWVSDQVIGIAHGPMILCIENARSGLVWDNFMNHPAIAAGLERAGFGPKVEWPQVAEDDEAYLRDVMKDTWDCIAFYVAPETGLPYDTSTRDDYSSVTNLGYYAASCAIAAEIGYITHDEAVDRVRRVLDSYEQFEKWNGFSESWNNVHTRERALHDPMISVLDSGNMVAGYVVAAQALPEVREQVERIVNGMNWAAFYDENVGLLYGGYNMTTEKMDPGWHVGDYAGDGRIAHFWAIASGVAPAESWKNLGRKTEEHFDLKIYGPGWMGGGLFMQSQDGLFLDEQMTPAGRSTANFAYAQMLYAKTLDLPAWGWSASFSPDDRYLGWGGLEANVVTPHAAGMAAMHYPAKAAESLRTLEEMGARDPMMIDGEMREFGFRDSIDLTTGAVSDKYLPALDQTMLFFSLANVLEDGVVQRLYESHPTVKKGLAAIDEFTWPADQGWLAELKRRDTSPLVLPGASAATGPESILIDDFEGTDPMRNRLGGQLVTWKRDAADDTVNFNVSLEKVQRDGAMTGAMRIDYDVDSPNLAFGGATFDLEGIDASGARSVQFWAKGTPNDLKIELHGAGGVGVARLNGLSETEWRHFTIPYTQFGGMITDWSRLTQFFIVFEDGHSVPKEGTLWLDDLKIAR